MASKSRRVVFIDYARSIAIVFAIAAHAATWLHVYNPFGNASRLATPIFALLFGVILELVYVPKIKTSGVSVVAKRLLIRSLQCYSVYLLTIWIGVLRGYISLDEAGYASIFLGRSLFNNILKFYAFALLLATPLLLARIRFGIGLPVAIGLAFWLIDPYLDHIPWPSADSRISYASNLLLGKPGAGGAGLSFLPSMLLIGSGMIIGHAVRRDQLDENNRYFRRFLATTMIVCISFLLVVAIRTSGMTLGNTARAFFAGEYERSNLMYIACGGLAGCAILVLSLALSAILPNTGFAHSAATLFGRRSLLAFGGGNLLLNCWPDRFRTDELAVINGISFFLAVVIVLAVTDKVLQGKESAKLDLAIGIDPAKEAEVESA